MFPEKFQIRIQSPFERKPVIHADCNADRALALYAAIDWAALWRTIEASMSSQESDYYYYEISQSLTLGERSGEDATLTISGWYKTTQVCVGLDRSKKVLRGFFTKKEVMESYFGVQMDHVEIPFAAQCLQAFIDGDDAFLAASLHDQEGDYE